MLRHVMQTRNRNVGVYHGRLCTVSRRHCYSKYNSFFVHSVGSSVEGVHDVHKITVTANVQMAKNSYQDIMILG